MKLPAAAMAERINRAVKSGKLNRDDAWSVPQIVAALGTTRGELSEAVNRDYGSIDKFCRHLGFGPRL